MRDDIEDLNEILYEAASIVLKIEEVDEKEKYLKEVCDCASHHTKSLFDQMYKKISLCKDESEREFVYDTTLTFLIHSLCKMCEILYEKDKLKECFSEKITDRIKYKFDEIKKRHQK